MILKIISIIIGMWAALRPAVYGFLFLFFFDSSVIFDFLVLTGCIFFVWDIFKPIYRSLWLISLLMLIFSAFIGFFHHFKDFGESGPLPYEWLNGYYKFCLPLVLLALSVRYKRYQKREITASPNLSL